MGQPAETLFDGWSVDFLLIVDVCVFQLVCSSIGGFFDAGSGCHKSQLCVFLLNLPTYLNAFRNLCPHRCTRFEFRNQNKKKSKEIIPGSKVRVDRCLFALLTPIALVTVARETLLFRKLDLVQMTTDQSRRAE